jgi:hypothetical protein
MRVVNMGIRKDDRSGMVDRIVVEHKDRYGKVISRREFPRDYSLFHKFLVKIGLRHNTISEYGMAIAAGLLIGTGSAFTYVGIGTGTTAAAVTDAGLQTQISRLSCTPTRITTTYTNDTIQLQVTFSHANDSNLTGTSSVTEVGVFNASGSTSQAILFHIVYSPADSCNWDQGDQLTVTATCQLKQGS